MVCEKDKIANGKKRDELIAIPEVITVYNEEIDEDQSKPDGLGKDQTIPDRS